MTSLFAISGPQGTGKTTILSDLSISDIGESIYIDEYKVSRNIQSLLGYEKLSDAYKTPKSMMEFQEKIIDAKYNRDSRLKESIFLPYIFTERSFLDIVVYSAIWISKLVQKMSTSQSEIDNMNDWYKDYSAKCAEYQKIYNGLFYISLNKNIKFEEDKNRADEQDAKRFEDMSVGLLRSDWGYKDNFYIINETFRNERVNAIRNILLNKEVPL